MAFLRTNLRLLCFVILVSSASKREGVDSIVSSEDEGWPHLLFAQDGAAHRQRARVEG